jgi:hypothetical protein
MIYKKFNLLLVIFMLSAINISGQQNDKKSDKKNVISFAKFSFSFDDVKNNCVTISSDTEKKKCGFIANLSLDTYVFTNQYSIMNLPKFKITDMDNNTLQPVSVEIAPEINIIRIKLEKKKWDALEFSKDSPIKTPIVFYSYNGKAETIKELYGIVVHESPGFTGVSIPFMPQDIGSPIFDKNKKVIGIASFLQVKEPENNQEKGPRKIKMRRIAYKVTPETKWHKVKWSSYSALRTRLREDKLWIFNMQRIYKVWEESPYKKFKLTDEAPKDLTSWVNYHNKELDNNSKLISKLKAKEEKGKLREKDVNSVSEKIKKITAKSGKAF